MNIFIHFDTLCQAGFQEGCLNLFSHLQCVGGSHPFFGIPTVSSGDIHGPFARPGPSVRMVVTTRAHSWAWRRQEPTEHLEGAHGPQFSSAPAPQGSDGTLSSLSCSKSAWLLPRGLLQTGSGLGTWAGRLLPSLLLSLSPKDTGNIPLTFQPNRARQEVGPGTIRQFMAQSQHVLCIVQEGLTIHSLTVGPEPPELDCLPCLSWMRMPAGLCIQGWRSTEEGES